MNLDIYSTGQHSVLFKKEYYLFKTFFELLQLVNLKFHCFLRYEIVQIFKKTPSNDSLSQPWFSQRSHVPTIVTGLRDLLYYLY